MSTFYFSGIEKRATAEALGKADAAGMLNRLQYSDNLMAVCTAFNLRLVMDCGSYSAPMSRSDIEAYAALIIKLGTLVVWYAMPDEIGNQEKSNENYAYLLSLLPEHLHERVLWIYQYGADLEYLLEGLQTHQRIGIGGLVPLIQADRIKAYHVILGLAEIIRQYDAVPHFFGLSTVSIISALHQYLPDFSVDSTTWLAGARYGLLISRNGQQHSASQLGFDFDRESILQQNIRTMRRWVELVESVPEKKETCIQMSLFGEKTA